MPERTTIKLHPSTRTRLRQLKPFDGVTYDELLRDMADVYTGEKPRPRHAQAAGESAEDGGESSDTQEHLKTPPGEGPK